MAELLLGVDGGGSKTLALIGDARGTILGRGTASSSNYQSVGFAAATGAIETAAAAALREAGIDPAAPIRAACFGLAGVDRPADHARFEGWLRERALARRWTIVNDAGLVLAAGTPGGWGVALICGTGSICFGATPHGRKTRAGGWGYLIGDEGSGYAIGIEALRLATQTADGRVAAHALLQAILDHWRLAQPSDLIGYVYRPDLARAEIAELARPVAALAEGGDPFARELLERAANELGRLVAAVARGLDLHEPPVALGGGVIGSNVALQRMVVERAGVALGPVQYVGEPARGALVIARRLLESVVPV